jgi:endo-1,4-beta-xylanase
MADDDTWLSTFPISRLNLPLPFDTELQAKPAYWGIVDPTQLPGHDLTFSITSKIGPRNARVWTVTANNPGPGTAYTVQINGFKLKQFGPWEWGWGWGWSGCKPVITPPSAFPVVLGDLAQGSSASATFTINFERGCHRETPFVLEMPWSAANGADSHTLVLWNQRQ